MKKIIAFFILLAFLFTISACSGTVSPVPGKKKSFQQELVESSAIAVKIMRSDPDSRSLNYLLKHAKGVLIFPSIVKAGFLLAGGGGYGIMTAKDEEGHWSSPAFYKITGGSMGVQAGLQRTSVIFVFMNDRVFNSAIDSGMALGVDATIAAGSSSFNLSASTKHLSHDIYYFSSVEGIFAGIAMDGNVITISKNANIAYYEKEIEPREILFDLEIDKPEANVLKVALMTMSK